jgi:hypothetical protein
MRLSDTGTNRGAGRPGCRAGMQIFFGHRPRTVGEAVQAAVNRLDGLALAQPWPGDDKPLARTRAMVALLARCYALQIYSSRAVVSVMEREGGFHPLRGEALPDAGAIRRFRSENREAIHRCLVAALEFKLEQKVFWGVLTRVSHPQLAEEANRRIIMAAFMDSLELEGERAMDPPVEISFLFAKGGSRMH